MQVKKTIISSHQALEKSRKYCAYSERSHFDVRCKLKQWSINETEIEFIISTLIEEGFLNESRYAQQFVQGKIRINHWGKNKIKHALRTHHISGPSIKGAFDKIDMNEYIEIMIKEGIKKAKATKGNESEKQYKTIHFLVSKGFEAELIKDFLDNIFKPQE